MEGAHYSHYNIIYYIIILDYWVWNVRYSCTKFENRYLWHFFDNSWFFYESTSLFRMFWFGLSFELSSSDQFLILKSRISQQFMLFSNMSSVVESMQRELFEISMTCSENVANKCTVRQWFKKFCSSDFNLGNKLHGRPETKVDKWWIESCSESGYISNYAWISSKIWHYYSNNILNHLKQIDKVKKLGSAWIKRVLEEKSSWNLPFFAVTV